MTNIMIFEPHNIQVCLTINLCINADIFIYEFCKNYFSLIKIIVDIIFKLELTYILILRYQSASINLKIIRQLWFCLMTSTKKQNRLTELKTISSHIFSWSGNYSTLN